MKRYEEKQIKKEKRYMELERKKTELSKASFIEEIKSGLGEEIKAKPQATITEKPKEGFLTKILKLF